jgi:hypothetical protein
LGRPSVASYSRCNKCSARVSVRVVRDICDHERLLRPASSLWRAKS